MDYFSKQIFMLMPYVTVKMKASMTFHSLIRSCLKC